VSGGPPVEAAAFRSVMGRWATGVSVVTAYDGREDAGLTVNALLSVALEPPSLLVSLQREVDTLPVLRRSPGFAVSFLAADQRALSERFARAIPSPEKFRGLAFHRGTNGAALLDGALAGLEVRVRSMTDTYDHVLVVGEVTRIETGRDVSPLLFYRGLYAEAEGDRLLKLSR
jgi:3-hydroxy-9,10-secoandrosta-1,3,5(10)-triene-9,17-dione monooxygenase reductase component